MKGHRFFIVDVFGEEKYAGNQLAVVVPERNPATGSANGCLAGYLVKHAYFGPGPVRASVEQGFEMGRRSIIHLRAHAEAAAAPGPALQGKRAAGSGSIVVNVGGRVFEVAEGRLL